MLTFFLMSLQEITLKVPVFKEDGVSGILKLEIIDEQDKILYEKSKKVVVMKETDYIGFKVRIKDKNPDILRAKVIYNGKERIYSLFKLF